MKRMKFWPPILLTLLIVLISIAAAWSTENYGASTSGSGKNAVLSTYTTDLLAATGLLFLVCVLALGIFGLAFYSSYRRSQALTSSVALQVGAGENKKISFRLTLSLSRRVLRPTSRNMRGKTITLKFPSTSNPEGSTATFPPGGRDGQDQSAEQ